MCRLLVSRRAKQRADAFLRFQKLGTVAAERNTMHELFEAYLENPSRPRFRRLRQGVIRQSWYPPEPFDLIPLAEAMQESNWSAARERVEQLLPDWPTSLRVHTAAAVISEMLGDTEDAELERFVSSSLLRGVLEAGNGSLESPYPVTFWGDSAVVLAVLGLAAEGRELLETGNQRLDHITCRDGSQIAFDVTPLLGAAPTFPAAWRELESAGWPS